MNKYLRNSAISILFLLIISCGSWGWESIDTDNEEQLNVFGLISLDDSLESFVVVHKTLDTAGPDQVIVDEDIYGYPIYESLYVVKDATVIISNGSDEYQFERNPIAVNSEQYWYGGIFNDPAIYLNVDQSFHPQPDTEYKLHISTPAGLELTGTVITPPRPRIIETELADTLSIKSLFEIRWRYEGQYVASIGTNYAGDFDYTRESYICGVDQSGTVDAGDTTWTSSTEDWCLQEGEPEDPEASTPMKIRLSFLDENYYNYFLSTDNDAAQISNFLIGEGGIGTAYGVEGGFGVFGALSADWTQRIAVP